MPRATCPALPSFMSASNRIVGGKTATAPIPWQVAIRSCNKGNCVVGCGGTVLDRWTILTAAHCNIEADSMSIMVGQVNKNKGKDIKISKVINHNYTASTTMDNDISILKLATPLTLGKNIQAICLPSSTFNPAVGTTCFASGWGALKENGKGPAKLQYVGVPMVSFESCNAAYKQTLTANYICAGFAAGGKDSCQGDSGGPLVCMEKGKPVITGVVSNGDGCAKPKVPGVYTKVINYLTWIKANMGKTTISTAKPTSGTTVKPSSAGTPPTTAKPSSVGTPPTTSAGTPPPQVPM